MAKNNKNRKRRDNPYIANRMLPLPKTPSYLHVSNYLRQIEDRRTWHPLNQFRSARSFNKSHHQLQHTNRNVNKKIQKRLKANLFNSNWASVGFAQPEKVLVCVRRKIRKEIIHALRKAGKRGQRKPKRSFFSSIKCRR